MPIVAALLSVASLIGALIAPEPWTIGCVVVAGLSVVPLMCAFCETY